MSREIYLAFALFIAILGWFGILYSKIEQLQSMENISNWILFIGAIAILLSFIIKFKP